MKKVLIFCLFSALIGCVHIYPDIRFIIQEGKNFSGITMTAAADEEFYLSRLNGVYKGDYRLANVGLYEHRNDLWLVPPYFEDAIGFIGNKLNIPVQYWDIALSFIFPVINFWLIFLLIYFLTKSSKLGLIGASSILLTYALFTVQPGIIKQFLGLRYSQPIWFLRPFSPQIIYIPFILSLILIFLDIDTQKKWKLFIPAFLIASLNYLHIFLWAFLFVGLSVWLAIAFMRRDFVIRNNILIILFVSVVLSMPCWLNHYNVMRSPGYAFLNEMFGTRYSRMPDIPLAYILMGLGVIFLNRKSEPKRLYFLLSFLLGGVICLNQQIVTARVVEPLHFSTYTNKTFLLIGFVAGLSMLNFKIKLNLRRIIFVFLISLIFLSAFVQQNNYYNLNKNMYSKLQPIKGAVDWFNEHTNKDDVILTDSIAYPSFIFVRNLLVYTKNYHYLSLECHSLSSRKEKEDRIFSAMRFFEYSALEAESIIDFSGGVVFLDMSARYNTFKGRDVYLAGLKNKYRDLMQKDPVILLSRYKLDYILVGKNDHLYNTIEAKYPGFSKVFDDHNFKILKFKPRNV